MKNTADGITGEFNLIKSLKKISETSSSINKNFIIGIGDDCAVYRISPFKYALLTCDQSIENIHFRISTSSPFDIGYKSMMSNLSDIAAMGGVPLLTLCSIGIPDYIGKKFITSIYKGFNAALQKTGARIAGGDTSAAESLYISITVYGEYRGKLPLLRSGAKPGQTIYLTGNTGNSLAGFKILEFSSIRFRRRFPSLIKKHRRPDARFNLVKILKKYYRASAMIDISDGLVSDLRHIAKSSFCGFELIKGQIPLSDELIRYSAITGDDPLHTALNSGEEYELIFTSNIFRKKTSFDGIQITPIGRITESGMRLISDSGSIALKPQGYEHLKIK